MKNSLPKATHEGKLDLGVEEFSIECFNLDNGERVLSRIGFLRAMGRTGKAKGGRKYDEEFRVPVFLSASNIKSLVTEDLIENSAPIHFIDLNGNQSIGYRAELLPGVSYLYAEALDKGILLANQLHIGEKAKKLVKAFLKISIISLVDEATGYQYQREKQELQKILKAYISEELLPWQKKFPDIFYREIFRLNGWDFTIKSIQNRPGVVGKWTNSLIYKQLPIGILEELKRRTPRSKAGNYTAKFHQSLTEDTGDPNLNAQINSIIAIMQISDTWVEFLKNFNKMVSRRRGQLELRFEDLQP